MLLQIVHQDFHFRKRHPRSAGDMHEDVRSLGKQSATIHERIPERLR